jgi:hypothetical protein
MRSTFGRWLMFATCCVVAAGCVRDGAKIGAQSRKAAADKKDPKSKNAPASSPAKDAKAAIPTWTVEGWGKTEEDARKDAVRKVREKLAVDLNPPLVWTPPVDFVLQHFLTGSSQRHPDRDPLPINGEQLQCWGWTVSLPPKLVETMQREDSKYRAQLAAEARRVVAKGRMQELSKLVGCIVLALAGVSLYLRLDGWAEGTRRRWLRLALSSAVAATGVGWWFLS